MTLFSTRASGQSPKKPDFAFPTKVTAYADKNLQAALAAQDAPAALRSLIDWTVATTMLGADGTPREIVERADSVASALSDPAAKALGRLLQARLVGEIYEADSWKYNRRELPLEPRAANPLEWSGDQFRAYVNELVDQALEPVVALKATSISAYSQIISLPSRLTAQAYPTLLDFVASQAVGILEGMGADMPAILPSRFLGEPALFLTLRPQALLSAEEARILHIFQVWEGAHPQPGAPMVVSALARIGFVRDHLAFDDNNDTAVANALKALHTATETNEWSALVALQMAETADSAKARAETYKLLENALAQYPAFALNNNIRNRLAEMSQPKLRVEAPRTIVPGQEFSLNVSGSNLRAGRIDIYSVGNRVDDNDNYYRFRGRTLPRRVATLNVAGAPESVPFDVADTLKATISEPGRYIFVPSVTEEPNLESESYSVAVCSDILGGTAQFDRSTILAVAAADGAPVEGAIVEKLGRASATLGKTNSEGMLADTNSGYSSLVVKKNGSTSPSFNSYSHGGNSPMRLQAEILTSLNLYRPGDTVEWSAVAYSIDGEARKLLPDDTKLTLTVYDANNQPVDTLEAATDIWGRVAGSFTLPTDGLQGDFRLALHSGDRQIGWKTIQVSDYKLPTFEVLPDKAQSEGPKGSVILRGKALAYTGFPIADANVDIVLEQTSGWWWGNRTKFYAAKAVTGEDGKFSLVVPAGVLDNAPYGRGIFIAHYSVTSLSGETRQASGSFTRSTLYAIESSLTNNLDVAAGQVTLPVKVVDSDSTPQPVNLHWSLDDRAKGSFNSTNPIIDFTGIPSGTYKLTLTAQDALPFETQLTIYRPDDSKSPSDELLWTPAEKIDLGTASKGELLVGVAKPTHVLMGVWTPDSLYTQSWIALQPGLHHLDVMLPNGVDQANVTLAAVADARASQVTVAVEASARIPKLEILAESFRDRITPGAAEKWRLKVVTAHTGRGRQAAVMAKLYNAALDALALQGWNFSFARGQRNFWNVDISTGGTLWENTTAKLTMLKENQVGLPYLNTWGRPLYNEGNIMNYSRSMKLSAPMVAGNSMLYADQVVDEHKSAVEFDEAVLEESTVTYDSGAESSDASGVTGTQPFAYRTGETPLAFFRPMLTSAPDGSLTLEFTVSNANTRWEFNAVAYTERLLHATLNKSAVAAKPIMVQPNLPRFLRQGDKAVVAALVMNNSGASQTVNTVVEIFDPANGTVKASFPFTNTLAPSASATVSIDVDAPFEGAFIGYRVKSTAGNFSDGEQALIPILAASQPVVEAIPFYLAPDQHNFDLALPKMKTDARVTLEMTENPVWTVVTALPGLIDEQPATANQAAASLFAAASAKGIVKANPAIEEALREWSRNPSDSTLVSMLQRNNDLKNVLLQATPWMLDAASDTERMARLALLLNPDQADQTISRAIKTLEKLQTAQGGWCWMGQISDPSEWVTSNVLMMLGRLKKMGILPHTRKLNSMIAKAVRWIDGQIAKEYEKYPNGNYMTYTFMRDLFPDVTISTGAGAAVSATVQQIIGRWKDLPLVDKALGAIILDNHTYRAVAKQVVASILDFSQKSAAKGWSWPSLGTNWWNDYNTVGSTALLLDAIATVTPDNREAIDGVRQWLILQKQAQDWGSSVSTAEVVAIFLTTSKSWLQPAQGVKIDLGGTPVEPAKVARVTGYFRTPLADASAKTLTIDKAASTPAYGAVYMQYRADMADIKGASTEDVAITKRLLRIAGTQVEEVKPGMELHVGDRVRVELNIQVERTVDYVAINDSRPACLEPVEQLPQPVWSDGICFYRENRDSSTNIYVTRMPKGIYLITTDYTVNNAGIYQGGMASLQSQYAPAITAHSASMPLHVD